MGTIAAAAAPGAPRCGSGSARGACLFSHLAELIHGSPRWCVRPLASFRACCHAAGAHPVARASTAQGILERMKEIELEMQRTQKNKARAATSSRAGCQAAT
jgi:hypothetical protein